MSQIETSGPLAALHQSSTHFKPTIPIAALPYLAFVLLASFFLSAFYFTTLPKQGVGAKEVIVALLASLQAGFGVVALFNAVGVYI